MTPHLLLVEDSANVTNALRTLFEASGHRVRVAPTVDAAVRECVEAPPDLMLLDLTLPDGDGLLVLSRLRGEGREPPPTAAMTGHDDPDTARRCADAGCLATLVKPVPTRELLKRVREWLDDGRRS
jgi:DNA-binding response OmpR family regulator